VPRGARVMQKRFRMASVAAASAVVGIGGTLLVLRGVHSSEAKLVRMDLNAQILQATPARELIVMNADARVFSKAQKNELLAQRSTLNYLSRARFAYSVDMRALNRESFRYDAATDVLKVRLPQITIRADVYGPRERMADLALLAFEGGSGNELERVASAGLEKDALREASRPELIKAAVSSAKYEVSKLYEDAFRAAGRTTRVVVLAHSEPLV
jgi:hypothetical protein